MTGKQNPLEEPGRSISLPAPKSDSSSKGRRGKSLHSSNRKPAGPSKQYLRKAGAEYAAKNVERMFKNSMLGDLNNELPKFTMDELQLGKLLGKGGFGSVNEIRGFTVGPKPKNARPRSLPISLSRRQMNYEDDAEAEDGFECRLFISEHCTRNGGDARYAVKYLSPEVIQDPALYIQGITDMAVETHFLTTIEHPNIVKMRATSAEPYTEKYFIVMDRLYDTLGKRLQKWLTRHKRCTGMAARLNDRDGSKAKALLEERLMAAYDLSDALEYLHNRKIIYRDIKPENIGFDIRDDIKIFDFGLSKELTPDIERLDDNTYKLTGLTGTVRYMAPEVGLEQTYNLKCDVYSLAILVWEMLALKKPYANYLGVQVFKTKIFKGGKRPPIDHSWPQPIILLLSRGWDGDLESRHSMHTFSATLKAELVQLRDGDESGMEHTRRRSTFVFRKEKAEESLRPSATSS